MALMGSATTEGTRRYAQRLAAGSDGDRFHLHQGLWLSSIGLGTYLGDCDDETDRLYTEAVQRAVELGCNVVDTAINYRCQRSERVVGRTLAGLIQQGVLARDEVVITTKGGYLPFDTQIPQDPMRYYRDTYQESGLIKAGELVAGCHCLAPAYLADQLARSRSNLGLDCLDLYYLHNPETQLQGVSQGEFLERLRAAFGLLEEEVARGRLRLYGLATWSGFRVSPTAQEALSLEQVIGVAREVAGPNHHCRVIQLPYNLAMPEAVLTRTQRVGDASVTILDAARRLEVTVMASASLAQGQLARRSSEQLTDLVPGLETAGQRALQVVRSTPGVATALVGMRRRAHVEENLRVATAPPLEEEQLRRYWM